MSNFDRVSFWRRPSFQLVAWVLAVVTPLAALGQAIQNDGNDQNTENDKRVSKDQSVRSSEGMRGDQAIRGDGSVPGGQSSEKFGNVQKSDSESSLPHRFERSDGLEGLEGQISPTQAPEKSALIEPSQLSRMAESNLRLTPHTDNWTRFYNAGLKSSQMRRYEDAESRLLSAIKEAKKVGSDEAQLIHARIALADVYLVQDRFVEAEKLYTSSLMGAQRVFGKESEPAARTLYGLATINFVARNYQKAEGFCKQSIAIDRKDVKSASHDLAQAQVLMGVILGWQGWIDEAEPLIVRGLWTLEKNPGYKQLDYADALRMVALYRESRAQTQAAEQIFDRVHEILEAAVEYDKPPRLAGAVRFRWESGSSTSQEIPDNDFPLRYINANGVRVAATIVDLWELMGVLICITDTGTQRVELGLGKVNLERLSLDLHNLQREKLEFVDPYHIDRIRRERVMWDLTYTRPWLANIQKTRTLRGFVPPHGHDLFRGPNIFGIYGEWGAVPRVLPDKFAIDPSPERVQYQAEHDNDSGMERNTDMRILGLLPVSLEPFESRTGYLFYMNPRCESVLLSVKIGNATFEIPFKLRKRRIS